MTDGSPHGGDPVGLHQRNVLHLGAGDVVVAGDPGAGNALVGNILLELGLPYLDPYTEIVGHDGASVPVPDRAAYRRRMAATAARDRAEHADEETTLRFVKTHMHPESFADVSLGGALLLVRDPRDTIYSGYRWFSGFSGSWWTDATGSGTSGFAEFLGRERFGDGRTPVSGWTAFHEHWLQAGRTMARFAVVRFEDLKRDPVAAVTAMLAPFGVVRPAEEIERAVRASSFEAMRAHEDDEASAAEADDRTASARIMRRGAVGEWQEWIDQPGVAQRFDDPALAATAARFGYRLTTGATDHRPSRSSVR